MNSNKKKPEIDSVMVALNPVAHQVCLAMWIKEPLWTAWVMQQNDFDTYLRPILSGGESEESILSVLRSSSLYGTPLTEYQAHYTFPLYDAAFYTTVAEVVELMEQTEQ